MFSLSHSKLTKVTNVLFSPYIYNFGKFSGAHRAYRTLFKMAAKLLWGKGWLSYWEESPVKWLASSAVAGRPKHHSIMTEGCRKQARHSLMERVVYQTQPDLVSSGNTKDDWVYHTVPPPLAMEEGGGPMATQTTWTGFIWRGLPRHGRTDDDGYPCLGRATDYVVALAMKEASFSWWHCPEGWLKQCPAMTWTLVWLAQSSLKKRKKISDSFVEWRRRQRWWRPSPVIWNTWEILYNIFFLKTFWGRPMTKTNDHMFTSLPRFGEAIDIH